MGILTKIFVVLVTIVSIVLVSLIIPFVDNTFYYQKQMVEAESLNRTLRQRADEANKNLRVEQKATAEVRNNLLNSKNELSAAIDQHTSELKIKQAEVVELKNELARKETTNIAMSESVQKLTSINNMLSEEVKALRKESMDHKLRNIELDRRISELSVDINRYVRSIRALKEEVGTGKAENDLLKQTIEDMKNPGKENVVDPVYARNIIGMVTAVETIGLNTLVELNIGSNDKVAEKMEFLVHQDGRYVGTLVITTVELNASAGLMRSVVDDVKPNMEVLVNTLFR